MGILEQGVVALERRDRGVQPHGRHQLVGLVGRGQEDRALSHRELAEVEPLQALHRGRGQPHPVGLHRPVARAAPRGLGAQHRGGELQLAQPGTAGGHRRQQHQGVGAHPFGRRGGQAGPKAQAREHQPLAAGMGPRERGRLLDASAPDRPLVRLGIERQRVAGPAVLVAQDRKARFGQRLRQDPERAIGATCVAADRGAEHHRDAAGLRGRGPVEHAEAAVEGDRLRSGRQACLRVTIAPSARQGDEAARRYFPHQTHSLASVSKTAIRGEGCSGGHGQA